MGCAPPPHRSQGTRERGTREGYPRGTTGSPTWVDIVGLLAVQGLARR